MLVWMISATLLVIGGILGASQFIAAARPGTTPWINRLTPFEGLIGVLMMAWGAWGFFNLLRALPYFSFSFAWLVGLATVLVELGLGFLLAYGLIAKHALSKHAAAQSKGELLFNRLSAFRAPMGLSAIVLAVVFVIVSL